VPKQAKQVNNDFCPECGQTFPREQRDYHLMNHYKSMNRKVLDALDKIRQELAQRTPTQ
jgi:DNA repair exonuclease SbcCD ATPase subunit